ncbi:MAG TPA: isoprenylcysteine carboxylmethyltransferase family protein [Tenuifilaceae bacterium]|nr:isoprenylcysteine carboxylmethyltransferase family protein [Tenuifilaceae bacterium]HPN23009.1 isoprenylcysteine carboxylmethyltransferase family protein [Tenuifilaceae bacterium]
MKYLILLSILFFLSEFALMLVKRSKKIDSKRKNDKGSLVLLWVIITLCFTFGFTFANYRIWTLFNYVVAFAGVTIILLGATIRWISIIQLSSAFTVNVAIANNHKLKTDGVYKYVRHPSYFGLLFIMFGFSVSMNSYISILIITIPMFLAILYRIKVEEEILLTEFGDEYSNYKKNTKKLIPGLI